MDTVKLLIQKGAVVNSPVSCINLAIENASIGMVNFFLENGIDVNMKDPSVAAIGGHSCSLMFSAVTQVYKCFLPKDRYEDRMIDREQAMSLDKSQALHKIMQILFDNEADLTVTNEHSETLFTQATLSKPNPEALVMLLSLDFKAVICQQDKKNAIKNILQHVVKSRSFEMVIEYHSNSDDVYEHMKDNYVKIVQLLCALGFDHPKPYTIAESFPFIPGFPPYLRDVCLGIRDGIAEVLPDVTQPHSLKHFCRLSIWEKLGKKIHRSELFKYMPKSVKSFVLFGEFTEPNALLEPGAAIDCERQFISKAPIEDNKLAKARVLLLCNDDFYMLPRNERGSSIFSLHYERFKKIGCFSVAEAQEIITAHLVNHDVIYNVIILHITETANNLSYTTESCAEDISNLAITTAKRWPNVKVIISQSLPKLSYSLSYYWDLVKLDEQIKWKRYLSDNVHFVEYELFDYMGRPLLDYFDEDCFALSHKGVSVVAETLDSTVRNLLGLDDDPY